MRGRGVRGGVEFGMVTVSCGESTPRCVTQVGLLAREIVLRKVGL